MDKLYYSDGGTDWTVVGAGISLALICTIWYAPSVIRYFKDKIMDLIVSNEIEQGGGSELEKAIAIQEYVNTVVSSRKRFRELTEELYAPYEYRCGHVASGDFKKNIKEIFGLINSRERAREAYFAIKYGMELLIRRGEDSVVAKPVYYKVQDLELYTYMAGLEALEKLNKEFQVGNFQRDIKKYCRLTTRRIEKGCETAKEIGLWLKGGGYLQ